MLSLTILYTSSENNKYLVKNSIIANKKRGGVKRLPLRGFYKKSKIQIT